MLEVERPLDNRRLAADRALQLETSAQRKQNCSRITFHMSCPQITQITEVSTGGDSDRFPFET